MLLEKKTGKVHNIYDVEWFAGWLEDSYSNRTNDKVPIHQEFFRPVKRPIILNCMDGLYGHSLLKLLNAQYYIDNHDDKDLVVIIPKFLRWMVPVGVASVWVVDLPLRQCKQWNEAIAELVNNYFQKFDECYLSIALPHPDPSDFNIERFTSVKPFETKKWQKTPMAPSVTFIWREDRLWNDSSTGRLKNFVNKFMSGGGPNGKIKDINIQKKNIITLAEILKRRYSGLKFSVAGVGEPGDFPTWISDRRAHNINELVEKKWCTLYAESDVVIGVHGSNMLLPSALSGAIIELVPDDRWMNILQDILVSNSDVRVSMSRIRLLNIDTTPSELAMALDTLIRYMPVAIRNFSESLNSHEFIKNSPYILSDMQREISAGSVKIK
jgi:hypothetical protein